MEYNLNKLQVKCVMIRGLCKGDSMTTEDYQAIATGSHTTKIDGHTIEIKFLSVENKESVDRIKELLLRSYRSASIPKK